MTCSVFSPNRAFSKEEFYLKYWSKAGPDDGRIEVQEVREE